MPDTDDMLRAYLAARDEPCPGCNYNLRALTGTRCPECNQELTMRVGLVEPRIGACFVVGLIGVCGALGVYAVILGLTSYVGIRSGWRSVPGLGEILPVLAGFLLSGVAIHLWLKGRTVMNRRSAGAKWGWVFVAWICAWAGLIWFFLNVR